MINLAKILLAIFLVCGLFIFTVRDDLFTGKSIFYSDDEFNSKPDIYVMDPNDPYGELIPVLGDMPMLVGEVPKLDEVEISEAGLLTAIQENVAGDDTYFEAVLYEKLAWLRFADRKYELAHHDYEAALQLYLTSSLKYEAAATYSQLARLRVIDDDLPGAIVLYKKAEDLYEEIDDEVRADYTRKVYARLQDKM